MAARFYAIKDEVRIIGFDDGPFRRGQDTTLVVGAVFRGGRYMDGLVSTRIAVDGLDSTARLASLLNASRFRDARAVMVDGIAFGGFNVVDIHGLSEDTGMPVIAVTRDMPDFDSIGAALRHLPDSDLRWRLIKSAGAPEPVETRPGKFVHIQSAGISGRDARAIVKVSATRSLIPEPLRVAHLVAQGIVSGQSKGNA